jgi:ATP-dependent Clp protease ATP-binding subunit ClpA
MLSHNRIGPEHVLLGLIREGESVAARALGSLGIDLPEARDSVRKIVGQGTAGPANHIPFTAAARGVLEVSFHESIELGHDYIGTEHVLLSLARLEDGVAHEVLGSLRATPDLIRAAVMKIITERQDEHAPGTTRPTRSKRDAIREFTLALRKERRPTCPGCSKPLEGALAAQTIPIVGDDELTEIRIAYCGRCGVALGPISWIPAQAGADPAR